MALNDAINNLSGGLTSFISHNQVYIAVAILFLLGIFVCYKALVSNDGEGGKLISFPKFPSLRGRVIG